jgi:tetratricopeptide (TPR) repeat protein
MCAVVGVGGVGKTAAVAQYCRRFAPSYPGGVLWLDASSTMSLQRGVRTAATEVLGLRHLHGEKSDEVVFRLVREALEATHDWLLVLDGVASMAAVLTSGCLPATSVRGHVIVVAAAPDVVAAHVPADAVVAMGPMALGDSLALICSLRSGRMMTEREAMTQLLEAGGEAEAAAALWIVGPLGLDGLPLAMHQAVGYIVSADVTFAQYKTEYDRLLLHMRGGSGSSGASSGDGSGGGVSGGGVVVGGRDASAAAGVGSSGIGSGADSSERVHAELRDWLTQRDVAACLPALLAVGVTQTSHLPTLLEGDRRDTVAVPSEQAAALWTAVEEFAAMTWRATWHMSRHLLEGSGLLGSAAVQALYLLSFLAHSPVPLALLAHAARHLPVDAPLRVFVHGPQADLTPDRPRAATDVHVDEASKAAVVMHHKHAQLSDEDTITAIQRSWSRVSLLAGEGGGGGIEPMPRDAPDASSIRCDEKPPPDAPAVRGRLEQLMQLLVKQSLASYDSMCDAVTVHGLLQAAVRSTVRGGASIAEGERGMAIAVVFGVRRGLELAWGRRMYDWGAALMESRLWCAHGLHLSRRWFRDVWVGSRRDDTVLWAMMLLATAVVLTAVDHLAEAEALLATTDSTLSSLLLEEHNVELFHVKAAMVALSLAQGRLPEAETLVFTCFRLALRLAPSASLTEYVSASAYENIASSLNSLALVYKTAGRLASSQPLFERHLMVTRELHGSGDHIDVALAINNLADVYMAQGRFALSEPMYAESLEMLRRLWGPRDHVEIANTQVGLARCLRNQNQLEEAEQLMAESYESLRRLWGDVDHRDIMVAMTNLAGLHRDRRKFDSAEPLYRRALAMGRRLWGVRADRAEIAVAITGLATVHHATMRLLDAEAGYRGALEMYRRIWMERDPVHIDIQESTQYLETLLASQRRFAEAAAVLTEYVTPLRVQCEEKEQLYPWSPVGLELQSVVFRLAQRYHEMGDSTQAAPLYQYSLKLLRQLRPGEDHADTIHCLEYAADALKTGGALGEALAMTTEALAMRRRLWPSKADSSTVLAINNVATLNVFTGSPGVGEKLYHESLGMARSLWCGADHTDVSSTLFHLGRAYLTQGLLLEAQKCMQESERMMRRLRLPDATPLLAMAVSSLESIAKSLDDPSTRKSAAAKSRLRQKQQDRLAIADASRDAAAVDTGDAAAREAAAAAAAAELLAMEGSAASAKGGKAAKGRGKTSAATATATVTGVNGAASNGSGDGGVAAAEGNSKPVAVVLNGDAGSSGGGGKSKKKGSKGKKK